MNKRDVDQIKTEYVTGNMSIRALAKKHNVPVAVLNRRSKEEGWVKLRQEYKTEVIAHVVQNAMRTREEEISSVIHAAELVELRGIQLLEADNALEALLSTRAPGKELESISKALLNVDELRRTVRGIMSPRDADRSKLDWEKYRAERADKDAEAARDNTVHVVFEGMEDLSV